MKSAFDAALNLLHPPPPEHEPEPEFESQPEPAVEAPDASEEEEEDDDDPDDDDDLEDEGSRDPSPGPQEVYQDALRGALNAVCADETMADPQERAARLQSIQAFDPLGVRIPTLEEARRMSQRVALRGRGPAARSRGWWWPQPKCTALHVCRLRAILGVGHTFRQGARRARAPQTVRHHCADRRHKTCCSRHARTGCRGRASRTFDRPPSAGRVRGVRGHGTQRDTGARPRETVEKLDGDLRRRLRGHARITRVNDTRGIREWRYP